MFGLTPAHLVLILIIALIVVGPGKLPEVGSAMGKTIREFQKATSPLPDGVGGTAAQPAAQGQVQPAAVPISASVPGYAQSAEQTQAGDFSPIFSSPVPAASSPPATAVAERPVVAPQVD
jgi:sec-independent protein translocase protein TatA